MQEEGQAGVEVLLRLSGEARPPGHVDKDVDRDLFDHVGYVVVELFREPLLSVDSQSGNNEYFCLNLYAIQKVFKIQKRFAGKTFS